MQTALTPEFAGTAEGIEADAILRKCVHCGFCTATCPTYQLLGDELDGPRGRIYLIKQVLEGHAPTRSTQLHLDRCLTCRNCETTCPSGVQYGNLVEIGRRIVDERVPRPPGETMLRTALRTGLTSPLFKPALKAGQMVRGLLPGVLKAKVPPAAPARRAPLAAARASAQGAAAARLRAAGDGAEHQQRHRARARRRRHPDARG
jgi:glycolate oxidase iron-sulfur subunit